METITKRANRPPLSGTGEHVLAEYEQLLRIEEDLTNVTIHNSPLFLIQGTRSDLQQAVETITWV